jgi:hypothetical protein
MKTFCSSTCLKHRPAPRKLFTDCWHFFSVDWATILCILWIFRCHPEISWELDGWRNGETLVKFYLSVLVQYLNWFNWGRSVRSKHVSIKKQMCLWSTTCVLGCIISIKCQQPCTLTWSKQKYGSSDFWKKIESLSSAIWWELTNKF